MTPAESRRSRARPVPAHRSAPCYAMAAAAERTYIPLPARSPGPARACAPVFPTRRAHCSARSGVGQPVPVGRPARPGTGAARVWAAMAVRTRILVRVISRLDCNPARASAARDPSRYRPSRLPPASIVRSRNGRARVPSTRTGCRRTPLVLPRSRSRPTPRSGPPARSPQPQPEGAGPTQRPALLAVEELRHDLPGPGHQRDRLLSLLPATSWILPVLSRHPPIKREPQTHVTPLPCPAAGTRGPGCQHIGARTRTRIAARTGHRHSSRSLLHP